jgi:hypothetical protein
MAGPYSNNKFTSLHHYIDAERVRNANRAMWRGLFRGAMLGLVVGAALYLATFGIGVAELGGLSQLALERIGSQGFQLTALANFSIFSAIGGAISNAVTSGVKENRRMQAEARTAALESKIQQLEQQQSQDLDFRNYTRTFLANLTPTQALHSPRNSPAMAETTKNTHSPSRDHAASILAERTSANAQEIAI